MRTTAVRWFPLIRGSYGLALLGIPGRFLRLAGQPWEGRARDVARVLGARQLAQAVLTAPQPSAATLALGVEADIAHALSMLALAVADRRRRRLGCADAVVATAFAAAGALATRRVRATAPVPPGAGNRLARVACLRDTIAARTAALTIPAPIRRALSTRPAASLKG